MDWLNKLTGKKEPEKPKPKPVQRPKPIPPTPETGTPNTEAPKDFTEIGGSPVPGLTLRHVLRGHTAGIYGVQWSPIGKKLASASADSTVHVWDIETGESIQTFQEPNHKIIVNIAWSPDGRTLAIGSHGYGFCKVA